jgi:hypothetical protein
LPRLSDNELTERDLQLVWALQGSILYLAVQRHVYRNLSDEGINAIIEDRVDAFLDGALSVVGRAAEAPPAQETSA